MGMKVRGVKQLKINLNKSIKRISTEVTAEGLRSGSMQLAMYASELTPVDTSNLINSQYIVDESMLGGWRGGVGYIAEYSAIVHNGPDRNWQKDGAQNLFLSDAGDRNFGKIMQVIIKASRI